MMSKGQGFAPIQGGGVGHGEVVGGGDPQKTIGGKHGGLSSTHAGGVGQGDALGEPLGAAVGFTLALAVAVAVGSGTIGVPETAALAVTLGTALGVGVEEAPPAPVLPPSGDV